LYGALQGDYRSTRFLTIAATSTISAWVLPGMRWVQIESDGVVKIFSMEGDKIYLDAKLETGVSSPQSGALSQIAKDIYAIAITNADPSGIVKVAKF